MILIPMCFLFFLSKYFQWEWSILTNVMVCCSGLAVGYLVRNLRLNPLVNEQNDLILKYEESYGVFNHVANIGEGLGEGYMQGAAENGDWMGMAVGAGIQVVARLVMNVVRPEQESMRRRIVELEAKIGLERRRFIYFFFGVATVLVISINSL